MSEFRKNPLRARFAVLLAAALLAAACSAPRLTYDRLDGLASWQLNQYVSLNTDPQQRFDADSDTLWLWRRDLELTRYARDLRQLSQAVRRPLTTAALTAWAQRIDAHWDRLLNALADDACTQMAALSDSQVASVLRRVDRDLVIQNDKRAATPEKVLRAERERRLLKTLRRWVGELDKAQRARVANWSVRRDAGRLEQRRLWRDQFARALASRSSPIFCVQVEGLFARSGESAGGGLYTPTDGNRVRWMEFLAQFSTTLSSIQRQYLSAELQKLAEDFEALAAETAG